SWQWLFVLYQGFASGIDITGTHGKDQITGLSQLFQLGSDVLQGGAEDGTGDLRCQVGRGDADGVCLSGGKDLRQDDLVHCVQFPDEIVKESLGAAVSV